ncbi:hypothetical protein J2S43_002861 [Catenuloplanes nepalensis]|uniref:Uncharacterized protein n=1 Tax=Catenuloplanes nepalensis TaxID=587533 RepID=A0ABT9MSC8_9ACTN|nr:hypothetical protein [Catenuloplanes nepalensis]MDP9794349.1 hypothetical protein [Catenuloplanes nepalensis]
MIMSLLLDLANILGGFLLAIALLSRLPRVGDDLARFAARLGAFGWIVGIVALVTGGYFLIVHLTSGPRVFHFEVVGIIVGVLLLWDRLTGRRPLARTGTPATDGTPARTEGAVGVGLILAIFGIIAIVVGLQGLVTPD